MEMCAALAVGSSTGGQILLLLQSANVSVDQRCYENRSTVAFFPVVLCKKYILKIFKMFILDFLKKS